MVTIKDIALAARVEHAADGSIAAIIDRVNDREEFDLPALPVMRKLWLVFLFSAPVQSGFHVAVEVWTPFAAVTSFDSGTVQTPGSGSGQVEIEVNVLVEAVGPYCISLSIDAQKVWEQVVFFAFGTLDADSCAR